MIDIHRPTPGGKSSYEETQEQRGTTLSALRIAATKARLEAAFFETLHHALRTRRIDCASAVAQVKREGLFHRLPILGSGGKR
jgi:predicted DNA-binding ribbon-helix-helix protein